MLNEIFLEEKDCVIKETNEKVRYIALMWRVGSQIIQLKPVFKADKGTIRTLADTGLIEYKKLKSNKE